MRGKLREALSAQPIVRIIPAHAGQTTAFSAAPTPATDHPRACGANRRWDVRRLKPTGSSPRMRGKRFGARRHEQCRRIIPAHAGQTTCRCARCARTTDHPRACGANLAFSSASAARSGSSPRMRGKLDVALRGSACRLDHPRACGANYLPLRPLCTNDGSSPRMRGKLCRIIVAMSTERIIPAHAGQTRATCGFG